jgi:hypothetical protein
MTVYDIESEAQGSFLTIMIHFRRTALEQTDSEMIEEDSDDTISVVIVKKRKMDIVSL